eukprot:gene8676-13411_t
MGCGAGKEAKPADSKKKEEEKYKPDEKRTKEGKGKETAENKNEAKTPNVSKKDASAAGADNTAATNGGTNAAAQAESAAASGRDKHMPGPLMALTYLTEDKECACLVSACGVKSDMVGLSVSVYNVKTNAAYSKAMSDDDLMKLKEGLAPTLQWPNFWKMFASALQKADLKVSNAGATCEIRMKSKSDPKEVNMPLELAQQNSPFEFFCAPMPRIFQQKRKQMEEEAKEEKKDDKKLREIDLAKKEAEYNLSEAILLAGQDAEVRLTPVLSVLREEASCSLQSLGEIHGEIAKTKQEIEKIVSGAPSHPLDNMYSCDIPPTPEPSPVNVESLGWDTDVFETSLKLPDVAIMLFEYHGLIDFFKMDRNVVLNFYNVLSTRCHDVPYHGHNHAVDCLIIMHFLLNAMQATIKFSKEDVMASLICASILDLDHEGFDDIFIKRAGSMLSMLYSDLYQNTQNNLTAVAELFYNPKIDLLQTLTPDQNKDVIETVREALFIKANVQMKMPMERLQDFKQLAAGGADWGTKDNIRHLITHMTRMVDWSCWGRPTAIHKKWMDRVAEEYYRQGDRELAVGLAPSSFYDTCWTTDRSRHDLTFSKGQATFIDGVILPLFEEMARLAPDLEVCVQGAKANKEAFDKNNGPTGVCLKNVMSVTPKLFGDCSGSVAFARVGPDADTLWITVASASGKVYDATFDDTALEKRGCRESGKFVENLTQAFKDSTAKAACADDKTVLTVGDVKLELPIVRDLGPSELIPYIKSYLELRSLSAMRYVDRKVDEINQKAQAMGNKSSSLHGEEKALRGCIKCCAQTAESIKPTLAGLKDELKAKGGKEAKVEVEDALAIKVRNPLKAPLPPGVIEPPDMKSVDMEMLKIIKSKFFTKEHGAEADLAATPDPEKEKHCNAIIPYLTSDFCMVTKNIDNVKRQRIYDLMVKLDDWDYDVFDLQ